VFPDDCLMKDAVHSASETRFDWPVCYEAERALQRHLDLFLARNSFAAELARRMREETGTIFLDWVDHFVLPAECKQELVDAGLIEDSLAEAPDHFSALYHPEAMLPYVLIGVELSDADLALAIRVENLADFVSVHNISSTIGGKPHSRFRRVVVSSQNEARLEAVERRGYRGFVLDVPGPGATERLMAARELWQTRRRAFESNSQSYRHTHATLDKIIELVGVDLATHIVFEGERAYWQARNRAGQIQKQRQDRLGLGWANHDHHTFRSSRECFLQLMRAMEKLGFQRRERYYAGEQAGWGAQILEQPVEGIVVFADVDLEPEETEVDFSGEPLPAASRLGTIGLWVGLHGESFLEAGMHHLEARFDFALVRKQLKDEHVAGMTPFSDFEFLKQAFTEGERWPVRRERLDNLLKAGLITADQFNRFINEGAIGSHLETLQRRGGFKGFNQRSVSAIIAATDPRHTAR
jgi:hypothetical protein